MVPVNDIGWCNMVQVDDIGWCNMVFAYTLIQGTEAVMCVQVWRDLW